MNIPNILLTALLGLGGMTLTIIHDDAREVVNGLKLVSEKQNADHAQLGINSIQIQGLQNSDQRQWQELSKKMDR